MKSNITFYTLLGFFLCFSSVLQAQLTTMDICATQKDPTTIQVGLTPSALYDGNISNLQFTLKWKVGTGAELGSSPFLVPGNIIIQMVPAGPVTVSGGYNYQTIAGFGFSSIAALQQTPWGANTEVYVYEVGIVDGNGQSLNITSENFQVANDPYSNDPAANRVFYAELNSADRTGTICTPINPFPVEWLTFTAEKINEHDVQLDWTTATETNSDYFVLEKSKDNGSFEAIGQVTAAGNSQTVKNYTYLDQTGMSNSNVYRIKQFDMDGTHHYSQTVEVLFDFYENDNFVIYPSPASSHAFLQTKSKLKGDVKFYISDLTGRILMQGVMPEETPNGEVKIDLADFAEGIYYVRSVTSAGKSYLNRLVKKAD